MSPLSTLFHAKCHHSSINTVFLLQHCVIYHLLIGLCSSIFYCVHTFIKQLSEAYKVNSALLSTPHKVIRFFIVFSLRISMPSEGFIVLPQPTSTVSLHTTSFLFLFYTPLQLAHCVFYAVCCSQTVLGLAKMLNSSMILNLSLSCSFCLKCPLPTSQSLKSHSDLELTYKVPSTEVMIPFLVFHDILCTPALK